jgi:putative oxidoreductase
VVMLLPLIFTGAGKLSLDHVLARLLRLPAPAACSDLYSAALALLVLGLPFLVLIPKLGAALLVLAAASAATARWVRG